MGVANGKPRLCPFYFMYIRFSHSLHYITSLLIVSKILILLMYVRFSHTLSLVTSLLIVVWMWCLSYVRKVFTQFAFRNLLTCHLKSGCFAYVCKVFTLDAFRKYFSVCAGDVLGEEGPPQAIFPCVNLASTLRHFKSVFLPVLAPAQMHRQQPNVYLNRHKTKSIHTSIVLL